MGIKPEQIKLEAIVKKTSNTDTIIVAECEKAELNGLYKRIPDQETE